MRKTILTIAIAIQSVFAFGQDADDLQEIYYDTMETLKGIPPEYGKWFVVDSSLAFGKETSVVGYKEVRERTIELLEMMGMSYDNPYIDNSLYNIYSPETDFDRMTNALISGNNTIHKIWELTASDGEVFRISFMGKNDFVFLLLIKM